MKILIVDQFSPDVPSPYALSQSGPIPFDTFCEEVLRRFEARQVDKPDWMSWRAPRVEDVDENFSPEMCTTTYRAGEDGNVEVWKYRWDTSG